MSFLSSSMSSEGAWPALNNQHWIGIILKGGEGWSKQGHRIKMEGGMHFTPSFVLFIPCTPVPPVPHPLPLCTYRIRILKKPALFSVVGIGSTPIFTPTNTTLMAIPSLSLCLWILSSLCGPDRGFAYISNQGERGGANSNDCKRNLGFFTFPCVRLWPGKLENKWLKLQ